jgi:hypothetical protein
MMPVGDTVGTGPWRIFFLAICASIFSASCTGVAYTFVYNRSQSSIVVSYGAPIGSREDGTPLCGLPSRPALLSGKPRRPDRAEDFHEPLRATVDDAKCVATVDVPPNTSLLIWKSGDCPETTAQLTSLQPTSRLTFLRVTGDHGTIERVGLEAVALFSSYAAGACAFVYGE